MTLRNLLVIPALILFAAPLPSEDAVGMRQRDIINYQATTVDLVYTPDDRVVLNRGERSWRSGTWSSINWVILYKESDPDVFYIRFRNTGGRHYNLKWELTRPRGISNPRGTASVGAGQVTDVKVRPSGHISDIGYGDLSISM